MKLLEPLYVDVGGCNQLATMGSSIKCARHAKFPPYPDVVLL